MKAEEKTETAEELSEQAAQTVQDLQPEAEHASEACCTPEANTKDPEKRRVQRSALGAATAALLICIKFLRLCALKAVRSVRRHARVILPAVGRSLCGIGRTVLTLINSGAAWLSRTLASAAVASARRVRSDLRLILPPLAEQLYRIGGCAGHVFMLMAGAATRFAGSLLSALLGTVSDWFRRKLKQPLYELWCAILTPFAHVYGSAASAHIRFKNASKLGFIHAVRSLCSSFWRFLGGLGELLRVIFNYVAPAVCIVFLISLVRYASTLQYAITVEYNGSELGTIENEAAYNDAQTLIQDKVTFTDDTQSFIEIPKFSVTVLNIEENGEQPIEDIDKLSEMMIDGGDVSIVYAYGLYMNDELIGVYSEENMQLIRDALNSKLNMYNTPETVSVSFEDNIVISEGRFIEDVLTDADGALELINGSTDVEAYYTVQKGDSVSRICDKLGITREDFDLYNPGISSSLRAGQLITYHYDEPNLNVITTHYEVYDQVIEHTIEYVESSRYEQYCEILLQSGSDGYENVTALVTETNGAETDRTVVSRTVLEEMVPRKFRVGTKKNTYLDGDTTIIDRLGTFCWPLGDEDCYISSVFGYRSWDHSNHGAIDIAGIPRGTDIYAACDGTVTYSGWYAAYGELIIVDCGGGYECYYAHCSKLLVDVGDKVEKGDVIAEVGMTGSASGNHLHFEMRKDKKRIDPLLALGGPGGHPYNMS